MDGHYQNNNKQYKLLLETWVQKVLLTNSWERFEDLHIDEIEPDFRDQNNWLEFTIFIYKSLVELLKNKPYSCMLVIQMTYSDSKINFSEISFEYIKNHLDLSPPSFYIYPEDNINFNNTIKDLVYLRDLSEDIHYKVMFKQVKESKTQYLRCVYVCEYNKEKL
jgi:hypothetical protein